MATALRKLLLVIGGMLIAAGVTYWPWLYIDHFTGAASSVYGMSAVIWAPIALTFGMALGAAFAFILWPRKPRTTDPAGTETSRDGSSFEA
jgi:hypothetical protein